MRSGFWVLGSGLNRLVFRPLPVQGSGFKGVAV